MAVSQQGIFAGNLSGMGSAQANQYGFKPEPIKENDPMSNYLHSMVNLSTAQGQQNLGAGTNATNQGINAMSPVFQYLTNLVRGDQADVSQTMQPEINRIKDSFSAARQMISQAPRGGGKAGVLAEAPYEETKQIGDIVAQARQGASTQLGNLANTLAGLGINLSDLGIRQEDLALNAALTQRQQNNAEKAATQQMIAGLAAAAGDVASAGIAAQAKPRSCWIAEAIYGIDDVRTHLVRAWLNGPFTETAMGEAVMWLYRKVGRAVAWLARRSSVLRRVLKPLFDMALRKAIGE
jgi:hypothetical protein